MPAGILPAGPASRPQAHVTPFPAPRDTAAAALVLFFVKFLLDISQLNRNGTERTSGKAGVGDAEGGHPALRTHYW